MQQQHPQPARDSTSALRIGRDHARYLIRLGRGRVRSLRAARQRPIVVSYGPMRYQHGHIELRPLRPGDAASWCEAQIANQEAISPWWAASSDWRHDHDNIAFVHHRRMWAHKARQGLAANFAVIVNGAVRGELTTILSGKGATEAEIVLWMDRRLTDKQPILAALTVVIDHLFFVLDIRRIAGYQSVDNMNGRRIMYFLNFKEEGVLRDFRPANGALGDYAARSLLVADWLEARPKVFAHIAKLDPELAAELGRVTPRTPSRD